MKNLPAAIAQVREVRITYKTHQIFKAFETFMFLKELTTSGKIQNVYGSLDAFMQYLASEVNVSRNTMYTRLEYLKKYSLVSIDKYGNIYLESWETIARRYKVKKQQFYSLEVNPQDSPKLEHILRTLTIAEHKNRMAFAFAKLIESNNQLRQYLTRLWGSLPQTIELMAEKILSEKILSFKRWSESFDFWHSLPSDFNASVRKLMQYFAFDDFRQVAYWKRILSRLGLITVQTRKYESKKCTRKANDLLNGGKVYQHLFYNSHDKIRIWQMPDAITINL
ncbi:MAG: hypothetical protein JST26_04770 [Bacteroidetes bacterium]|nr:hypothetical protein [Bacteroidota bacterium]